MQIKRLFGQAIGPFFFLVALVNLNLARMIFVEARRIKSIPVLDNGVQAKTDANCDGKIVQEDPLGLILNKKLGVEIIIPCGAAEKAGINGGDRILSVNDKPISTIAELQHILEEHPKTVKLAIVRQFAVENNNPNMTFNLEPNYGSGNNTRPDSLGINPGNTSGKLPPAARL